MGKSFSITIEPSPIEAEYLSVSDAMHQILDMVDALENTESEVQGSRQVVWRLTEAHTNSPPLTVTVEAFSKTPEISIEDISRGVVSRFMLLIQELLNGKISSKLKANLLPSLKRTFDLHKRGIRRTEFVSDEEIISIVPRNAEIALTALREYEKQNESIVSPYPYREFGALEVEVKSIRTWHKKPALDVIERLSGEEVVCVLSEELAKKVGEDHNWAEIWENQRLLVRGELYRALDSELVKRIEVDEIEQLPWSEVTLEDLDKVDILQGRSIEECLNLIRGEDIEECLNLIKGEDIG